MTDLHLKTREGPRRVAAANPNLHWAGAASGMP